MMDTNIVIKEALNKLGVEFIHHNRSFLVGKCTHIWWDAVKPLINIMNCSRHGDNLHITINCSDPRFLDKLKRAIV